MPAAADIGQWRDRPTASFWPKARLVIVTATVTSAAWVVAGALWLNARIPRPARPALPVAVVAPDKLMETANNWAEEILLGAPLSVRASKEAANLGLAIPLERALDSI
ncbi:MAG: hypothetical protein IH997_03230, partial [Proteobacteria bacterium]|nr:hypothetical protein [Pseudomonadota bacterium]